MVDDDAPADPPAPPPADPPAPPPADPPAPPPADAPPPPVDAPAPPPLADAPPPAVDARSPAAPRSPGAARRPPAAAPRPHHSEGAAVTETLAYEQELARSQLVQSLSSSFLMVSLRRAFRLAIKTNEVLYSERRALASSAGHVVDPDLQAFLAWRRSVLLVIALAFVPLTILRFVESFEGPPMSDTARAVWLLPAFTEGAFCLVAFWSLGRWTRWASQRRILFIAWLIYFVAPFVVYLYPFQDAFDTGKAARDAARIGVLKFTITKKNIGIAIGTIYGIKAMLVLAPKVISLMPGLIRASIVSKLQFPGIGGPGYLMLLAAPVYALFTYVIVLLPYQITGSVYLVVGMLGLMGSQIFIAAAGLRLTTSMARDVAGARIGRYWLAYILLLVASAAVMVAGLFDFVKKFDYTMVSVASTVLSFLAHVLLMTLIGCDAIVAGMHRLVARREVSAEAAALRDESEEKLRRFCS